MNEMYSEVREHLRRQHDMNVQEVRGKQVHSPYMHTNYNPVQGDTYGEASWTFPFKGKILLFLGSVMLFSLYIYGGQDVKKGAEMAFQDMNRQMHQIEAKEPVVKEAMGYVRGAYHEMKNFVNACFTDIEDMDTEDMDTEVIR